MPKIPTYQTSVDYHLPRGDVEAAGAPGRAFAKFGEAVGEFGGKVADIVAAREKADREAKATQAAQAAQAADAENQRADGTAKAMASLRQTIEQFETEVNPDAVMRRYWEQADTIGQDIAGGIRDKGARAQVEADYGNLARVQAALLQGDSLRRLAEQGRGDLQRNLGLYADVAAGARHPVEHDDAVALALREIQGKADAGFITAEDAGRIEQSFYGDLAVRQAQRAIAADPQAALDSLKGGEDFAGLDADARARLTAEAERAVQAQAVRAQTEQAAVRRDTQVRLPGYLDALRDGEAPDDTRFGREALAATLGAAEGGKRWAEIEQARRFGQAMAKVKWATPDDIAGLTGRAGDPSPALLTLRHAPGNLDGLSETDLIRHAVERRNQQLWSKPADYVLNNPRVAELHAAMTQATAPPQPADAAAALQGLLPGATGQAAEPPPMLSPEDRRAAIAAYANGMLAEQERLGVPENRRQVLPDDMARDLVRGLPDDPTKADQALRDFAADWGADWPRVLDDLKRAGLPAEYVELAATVEPVGRDTLARVLTIQKEEPGALRTRTGGDADGIDELVSRYRANDDGRSLTDDQAKLVKLLAYYYAQTTEPEEAVRRAISDFSGNVVLTAGSGGKSEAEDIADAWHDKGARQRDRLRANVKVLPPRNAVDMYDRDGKPVMSVDEQGNTVQVLAPEGVNFNVFAEMGDKDKKEGRAAILARLGNFVQGGPWDLQRPVTESRNGVPTKTAYDKRFVNAASVAIGIYAAAAGWDLHDILTVSNAFAAVASSHGKVKYSKKYKALPERNVLNTTIGYNMQKDGKIPTPE